MAIDAAHKSPWKTAHIVFGGVLLLGIALHLALPLPLHLFIQGISLHILGTPFLLLGSIIIIVSKRDLEMHNQPSEPKAATSMIVTSGMYRFSRNPLYLGLLLAFCGLAIATDKLWWLLLSPLAVVLTHYLLIAPEETYLERKFGDEYRAYKHKVRRWI